MLRSNYQEYLTNEERQLFLILVGLFSFFLGTMLAGVVLYSLPLNLSSLEQAQQLGIVGKTILAQYPKQLEIPYYILGIVISLFSGLSTFFLLTYFHYKKKGPWLVDQMKFSTHDTENPKPRMGLLRWGALALVLFLVTFHKDFIYKNWYWGQWSFYFEEGIYLRWINELLKGKTLYKDIYLQGGPFMVWPQYCLMKLFGPSIILCRYYAYICYFVGYLIVFQVSRELIKNRILMTINMVLIVYFYFPMFPGFQQSLGRFAFSLLPLYFMYKFFFNKEILHLLISAIILGFALLSSQELGISSLVAVTCMLAVFIYRENGMIKSLMHHLSIIVIGVSIPVLPAVVYFSFHHALSGLYEAMIKMPQYYMFGYGVPFPNILDLFKHYERSPCDAIEMLLAYWPIAFYAGSAFFCLALFLRKSFTNRNILFFGIVVLGGMMFQRAFGIYSLFKIKNVIYPLTILSIGYLDMSWSRVLRLIKIRNVHGRKVEILLYTLLLVFIASGLYGYLNRGFLPRIPPHIYRVTLNQNKNYLPIGLPRAENIYVPPKSAHKTKLVVEYIKRNTDANEPIYVFPYSPMYYFLADRPSATKYPTIYAIPKDYREKVVKELEEKEVNYIVYVANDPLVLGVSAEMRFPEIHYYIQENYQAERIFDDTIILKRKLRQIEKKQGRG